MSHRVRTTLRFKDGAQYANAQAIIGATGLSLHDFVQRALERELYTVAMQIQDAIKQQALRAQEQESEAALAELAVQGQELESATAAAPLELTEDYYAEHE